jgi:hypothetical protein
VRAFPVSPGRWLRVEGKLLTEVPWFFAAPTGANKVTVYWDGVPGATGYRVRWGTTSEELSEQFGGAAGDGSAIHGVGFGA